MAFSKVIVIWGGSGEVWAGHVKGDVATPAASSEGGKLIVLLTNRLYNVTESLLASLEQMRFVERMVISVKRVLDGVMDPTPCIIHFWCHGSNTLHNSFVA
ncbi:hypothetical protein CEXT_577531 [Caerostris extrusa]|uniref:Uncharacterized protein n=1 Tax=Caerostris extrusa TaxID=172846 RepID=A0AAV4RAJ2_CAEEX|nr:hypothetical protein CEXT_577531 [Caerostris extrusa]